MENSTLGLLRSNQMKFLEAYIKCFIWPIHAKSDWKVTHFSHYLTSPWQMALLKNETGVGSWMWGPENQRPTREGAGESPLKSQRQLGRKRIQQEWACPPAPAAESSPHPGASHMVATTTVKPPEAAASSEQ